MIKKIKFLDLNNIAAQFELINLTNNENNASISDEIYFNSMQSYYESVTFSFLYALLFLFGILANLIVIYVYLSDKSINKHSNYFFTNLGLSDILVLTVCIPVAITDLYIGDEWLFGKSYYFIEYCVTSVSSFTMISISIERYCAITNPFKVKYLFTKKTSSLILTSIWTIGILISLPFFWMVEYTNEPRQCHLKMSFNDLTYVFGFNTILIFIPAFGLSILYVVIIIKVKRRHVPFGNFLNMSFVKSIQENESTSKIKKFSFFVAESSKSEKGNEMSSRLSRDETRSLRALSFLSCSEKTNKKAKFTITISIITVVFYLCQLPARIFLCFSYLNDYMIVNKKENYTNRFSEKAMNLFSFFSHLSTLIYFLHCISNPIIYNLLSSKFRKAFFRASKLKKISSIYLFNSKSSVIAKHTARNSLYA